MKRIRRFLLIAVAVTVTVSVLIIMPFRWVNPSVTAFMLGDDVDLTNIEHRWVAWNEISESLPFAMIASEDQRFLQHAGIDFTSIQNSIEDARKGDELRGASTITQQVAKNLYLWRGRSYLRKGIEAYLAIWVDLLWPKHRILEVYLNIAELGPGIYGAGAASEAYFRKPASRLNDAEAALLAAVLPNPIRLHAGAPSEYVRDRQRWIIKQMQRMRLEQALHSLWQDGGRQVLP